MENTLEIKFLGAIGTVTGSCTAIRFSNANGTHLYLVDVGEKQGELHSDISEQGRKWLNNNAKSVKGIFITHAHLDHVGYLPELVMEHGFNGTVYCSKATEELMKAILTDSLAIKGVNKYKINDVFDKIKIYYLDDHSRGRPYPLYYDFTVTVLNSAHVLGSTEFSFAYKIKDKWETLIFSGDIGPNEEYLYTNILLKEFQNPFFTTGTGKINIVLESTYGNRVKNKENVYERRLEKLTEIITDAMDNNRTVIFPAFALNRSQEILLDLYYLGTVRRIGLDRLKDCFVARDAELYRKNQISTFSVQAESPLITHINSIYKKYLLKTFVKKDKSLGYEYLSKQFFKKFGLSDISDGQEKNKKAMEIIDAVMSRPTSKDSKKDNDTADGFKIIVSSSGMCAEGRVLKYLKQYLPDENAVVVLTGYQANNTNGYYLKNMDNYTDNEKFTTMLDNIDLRLSDVKCRIIDMGDFFTGHADQNSLFRYVTGGEVPNTLQTKVFLQHGQDDARTDLKKKLETAPNVKVEIPTTLDWYNLNTGDQTPDEEDRIESLEIGDITILTPRRYLRKIKDYQNDIKKLEIGDTAILIPSRHLRKIKELLETL